MLIGTGLEKSWWKRKMKISKKLKAKIKRVVKVPKAIRKSKVIGKVLSLAAIAAAVVFVPGIGVAALSGIKTAGAGLGSLAKLVAGGAKIIGKATTKTAAGIGKIFLVKKANGALVKVPITEAEDNEIEQEINQPTVVGVSAGIDPMKVLPLAVGGISLIASIYKLTR